jgi:hypothetical protein
MQETTLDENAGSGWWKVVIGITLLFLFCGIVIVCVGLNLAYKSYISGESYQLYLGMSAVSGVIYLVPPIGILMRTQWGLKFGVWLSIMNIFAFPIGTIVGLLLHKGLEENTHRFE